MFGFERRKDEKNFKNDCFEDITNEVLLNACIQLT